MAPPMFLCPAQDARGLRRFKGGRWPMLSETDGWTNYIYETDRWTDYIYVSGESPRSPGDTPLIICPKENHGGKGGNVVFVDGTIRWLAARDLDALVSNLYARAGDRVVVGDELNRRTCGRYAPVQSGKTTEAHVP